MRDKGLVVLTGCGHAGIVNIVRHAKRLTGVDRVYAVLGGFHLRDGPSSPRTVAALAEEAPDGGRAGALHLAGRRSTRSPPGCPPPSARTRSAAGSSCKGELGDGTGVNPRLRWSLLRPGGIGDALGQELPLGFVAVNSSACR